MTKKAKKTAAWLMVIFISVLLIAVAVWIAVGNSALGVTVYRIKKTDLPSAFDGYKIAQVSDLHNAEIGEGNQKVLDLLKTADPDIILFCRFFVKFNQLRCKSTARTAPGS